MTITPYRSVTQLDVGSDVQLQERAGDEQFSKDDHDSSPFAIKRRTELGFMSEKFLGKKGVYLFYGVMVVYLYGDLAIYGVSVPYSLYKVTGDIDIGMDTYKFYVLLFSGLIGPFCFFDIQGTAWLQYFTMVGLGVTQTGGGWR